MEEESIAIWKAMFRFDLEGQGENRTLPLVIHPVMTDWNPGTVAWETGWNRPGGDFDEELFARAELNLGRGAGQVSVDVTSILKEIVEDGYTCHGFLLTVDRSEGIGFSEADLARVANLGNARLDVSYRAVPPVTQAVESRENR
jgi:hypothetical protein